MKFAKCFLIAVTLGTVGHVYAAPAVNKITVDEIVSNSNHAALYQGEDSKGTVSMTIRDKSGRSRKRIFNILRKNIDDSDKDQLYYTLFRRPADVRGMVFMVQKHVDLDRDDDRWLYLPGLDLVKRIAASDKCTSFAGSDFLYEDISGRSPLEDNHQLIDETEKSYVVKNIPKQPDSVKFAYYLSYIDKTSFIPVKIEFFKPSTRLYRTIEVKKVTNIQAEEDGKIVVYPTVTKSVAQDLEAQTMTEMVFSNVQYNLGFGNSLFTERYLRRPPKDAIR